MRQILHPGPIAPDRMTAVSDAPVPLHFVLEPGRAVDEAIAEGFAGADCIGGFVELRGGRCNPFKYVIPAASPDGRHAAWYSATFEPLAPVEIKRASAIVGLRDDQPFIHCHGLWYTGKGPRMGHMLASNAIVVEPIEATGIGARAATFKALHDPETNFTLFEPMGAMKINVEHAGPRVLLAKVRPNEDISRAIENICSKHAIRAARIYGIGSLNGVRFADGTCLDSHATEVQICEGRVVHVDDRLQAHLHVDVVDMNGEIFTGELAHRDNPVCVTFELVIETIEP
jgi:predicted DNA-binding protein with PD1-like motif